MKKISRYRSGCSSNPNGLATQQTRRPERFPPLTRLIAPERGGFPRIQQLLIDRGANVDVKTAAGTSVQELAEQSVDLRQVSEELAVFDQLPDEITVTDAHEYVKLYQEIDSAEDYDDATALRALRSKAKMLLEDLVFKYETDPDRTLGKLTVSISGIVEKTRRLHPGEDPL